MEDKLLAAAPKLVLLPLSLVVVQGGLKVPGVNETVQCRSFNLRPAFALTNHKVQEATLRRVVLCLDALKIDEAMARVRERRDIRRVLPDEPFSRPRFRGVRSYLAGWSDDLRDWVRKARAKAFVSANKN